MNSHRRLLATSLAAATGLLISFGAASAQPAAAPADQAAPASPPAAAAPSAVSSGKVPAPPPGKGQIVFFRPSKFVGMALSYSIHEGDTGIGKLGNGSYFVMVEDPGPHAFTIQGEVTDTLHVEVDAGETQYVQQTLGVGIVAGRPHITPSDKATFDGMPNLKLSEKKPTDLKPGTSK